MWCCIVPHGAAGTDFRDGNESLTDSGYPRVMREWRRGTDLLTDSCVVYSGDKADVSVYMYIAKHRHHRCVRCTVPESVQEKFIILSFVVCWIGLFFVECFFC
jgi:prolyl oligopeptidase PreP (S9A serine peptidase family)